MHMHTFLSVLQVLGNAAELRPIGNGVCRWANGDEMAIIPKGYGDKEFMAETLLKIMDEEDVRKAILLQGSLYGFRMNMLWKQRKNIRIVLRLL